LSNPSIQSLVTRFQAVAKSGTLLGFYQSARSLALILSPIWAGYAQRFGFDNMIGTPRSLSVWECFPEFCNRFGSVARQSLVKFIAIQVGMGLTPPLVLIQPPLQIYA
jgi:hypothetical protein